MPIMAERNVLSEASYTSDRNTEYKINSWVDKNDNIQFSECNFLKEIPK